jgi:hypothetical protein
MSSARTCTVLLPFFGGRFNFVAPRRPLQGEPGAGALRWPRVIPNSARGPSSNVEQLTPA